MSLLPGNRMRWADPQQPAEALSVGHFFPTHSETSRSAAPGGQRRGVPYSPRNRPFPSIFSRLFSDEVRKKQ